MALDLAELEAANLDPETTRWVRNAYEVAYAEALAASVAAAGGVNEWAFLGSTVLAETGAPTTATFTLDWAGMLANHRCYKVIPRLFGNANGPCYMLILDNSDVERTGADGSVKLNQRLYTGADTVNEGNLSTMSSYWQFSMPVHNGSNVTQDFDQQIIMSYPSLGFFWATCIRNSFGNTYDQRLFMNVNATTTGVAKFKFTVAEAAFRGANLVSPARLDFYGMKA